MSTNQSSSSSESSKSSDSDSSAASSTDNARHDGSTGVTVAASSRATPSAVVSTSGALRVEATDSNRPTQSRKRTLTLKVRDSDDHEVGAGRCEPPVDDRRQVKRRQKERPLEHDNSDGDISGGSLEPLAVDRCQAKRRQKKLHVQLDAKTGIKREFPGADRRKAKKSGKSRRVERGDSDGGPFELTIEALQGRWSHSAGLGLFTVRGHTVRFDSGMTFDVVKRADGMLEAVGWTAILEKSESDHIVWQHADGIRECAWTLEDDDKGDNSGPLGGIDVKNIIVGKRQRAKVDYNALDRQLREEEERHRKGVHSDASGSDDGAGEAKEASEQSQELSQLQEKKLDAICKLFRRWMLSTRTPFHEERLKRRGNLSTTFPICMTGVGQRRLDKELGLYGVRVAHRSQGTVLMVDAKARRAFQERHTDLWEGPMPPLKEAKDKDKKGEKADKKAEGKAENVKAAPDIIDSSANSIAAPAGSQTVDSTPRSMPVAPLDETEERRDVERSTTASLDTTARVADEPLLEADIMAALELPASSPAVPLEAPSEEAATTKPAAGATAPLAGTALELHVTSPALPVEAPTLEVRPRGRLKKLRRVVDDSSGDEGVQTNHASPAIPSSACQDSGSNESKRPAETPQQNSSRHEQSFVPPTMTNEYYEATDRSKGNSCPTNDGLDVKVVPEADSADVAAGVPSPVPLLPPPSPTPPAAAQNTSIVHEPCVQGKDASCRNVGSGESPTHMAGDLQAVQSPPPARNVEEAKIFLDNGPPASEAAKLLAFLASQHVDAAVLARTKVGVTVNRVRKQYKGDAVLVALATELVDRWKQMWQQQRQQA